MNTKLILLVVTIIAALVAAALVIYATVEINQHPNVTFDNHFIAARWEFIGASIGFCFALLAGAIAAWQYYSENPYHTTLLGIAVLLCLVAGIISAVGATTLILSDNYSGAGTDYNAYLYGVIAAAAGVGVVGVAALAHLMVHVQEDETNYGKLQNDITDCRRDLDLSNKQNTINQMAINECTDRSARVQAENVLQRAAMSPYQSSPNVLPPSSSVYGIPAPPPR